MNINGNLIHGMKQLYNGSYFSLNVITRIRAMNLKMRMKSSDLAVENSRTNRGCTSCKRVFHLLESRFNFPLQISNAFF